MILNFIQKPILFLLILFVSSSYSQYNKCGENIDFLLKTLIEKSPSYQNLITDKNAFRVMVDSIKSIAIKDKKPSNCSEYLQKILRNIPDGHLTILHKNNVDFKDTISVNHFLHSEKFNILPKINLDSLLASDSIQTNSYNSLSDNLTIALVQDYPNSYKGYVKESHSKFWRKGELILKYTQSNNFYEGVIYNILKDPRYYKTSTLDELYKKFNISIFNRNECKIFNLSTEKLSYKIIDSSTLYVSIKSFKNNTVEENKEFVNFFQTSVLPNYNKYENIIFDVRNNAGGAMAYETLLQGIKKNKDAKKIYVIQNRKTASAAELFILHLSNLKKITTIGENTIGMMAFRHINQIKLPNYDYTLWLPIKIFDKNYKELLQYEFVGIPPQIHLNENEDWMEQTLAIVQKNNL